MMVTEASLTCPGCGTTLTGGARFCMQCGGAVTADGAAGGTPIRATNQLREQLVQATQGEYRVIAEVGRGGMAAVFLAEDLALGRQVAIKLMIPGLDGTDAMADRFLLEARTAAQLSHPNIIPIHAVRTTDKLRYFVMKFIAGRSLDQVLGDHGPLPAAVVQAILAQVGSALEHAHQRGVVHRDIKPANIMLDEDGTAIVADFGIAKVVQGVNLTQAGSAIGTPTYMSPEQCAGKPVTGASDQYALGCVAFELVAGRPPFTQQEVMPVLLAHVSDVPPPLLQFRADCPVELAAAIDKMLAKDPADRWPTLTEAVAAAEAGPLALDPAVRKLLRELSGAEGGRHVAQLSAVRLSPVPLMGTVVDTPQVSIEREPELLHLSIEPDGAVLQVGSGLTLHATGSDHLGIRVPESAMAWRSSAPEVVTVSASGLATARAEGEARITATSGRASAVVQIRVARAPVGQVKITALAGPLEVGVRERLSAVAVDQAGAVLLGRTIRWASFAPGILLVEADGTLEARAPGQVSVRAECEGQGSDITVEIRASSGELAIVPGEGALAVGQVVQLAAVLGHAVAGGRPALGVEWSSSDPTVLRVTADGEVTALRPGEARIRASSAERMAEVGFQVTRVDATMVSIVPRVSQIGVGEEVRLEAEATDRLGGLLLGRVVTWTSSNPKLARVSPDGTLRALAPGSVRVRATVGGGHASADLRIGPASVAALKLEPASLVLRLGESASVQAVAESQRGAALAGIPVEWQSSDGSVAAVSAEGLVTGLRVGSARIAATVAGRRATIAVEVRAPTGFSGPRARLGAP